MTTKKTKKKATRVVGSKVTPRLRATASAAGRRERTPRTVKADDVRWIARDNVATPDWWMLTDGYRVTIARQRVGETTSQVVTVPRHIFDAFADWYMTGVWKRPRPKTGEADR